MFDIGFPELILISIVALLVVGPDKLPETIRTISLWIGRFRRSLSSIKQEIENEIGADEIRAQLHNEAIMQDIENSKETLHELKSELDGTVNDISGSIGTLGTNVNQRENAAEKETKPKSSDKPGRANA